MQSWPRLRNRNKQKKDRGDKQYRSRDPHPMLGIRRHFAQQENRDGREHGIQLKDAGKFSIQNAQSIIESLEKPLRRLERVSIARANEVVEMLVFLRHP